MQRSRGEPRDHVSLARLVAATGVAPRVAEAFRAVDRAGFVPPDTSEPYVDRPIEILEQQTTSQPSLIAQMIDAADLLPGDRVLEIGTGFGFQTALLAKLTGNVISVERYGSIAAAARSNLERAHIDCVQVVVGDGWHGAADLGPFEAIIVSAAAAKVPDPLKDQMVEGGRLIIPLRANDGDEVWVYIRKSDRLVAVRLLTPARFVPLVPGEAVQSNE